MYYRMTMRKLMTIICHTNRAKKKNHIAVDIDSKKTSDILAYVSGSNTE